MRIISRIRVCSFRNRCFQEVKMESEMLGFSKNKKLRIRLLGDPILAAKAKRVEKIDDEVRALAQEMIDVMHDARGIGLAGNQIGLPLQLVVIDVDMPVDEEGHEIPLDSPGEKALLPKMPLCLINPELVAYSKEVCDFEEGCLSVPKIYANVVRPCRVTLKSQLLDGSEVELECGGLLARVLQHEIDHLKGIVYVQKVEDPAYGEIERDLIKMIRKNGQKNFKVRRLVNS